jgi:ATP adenylyltransferase
MDILYAPWRESYTNDFYKNKTQEEGCVFCVQSAQNADADHFILKRGKHALVILNKYPYNAGHLLVIPVAHQGELENLDHETRTELMSLITHSCTILKKAFPINGINVGLNLGKAAGGSIPEHLHFHLLPRFSGDTNFLPLLANTKVVSFDLRDIYNKLKPYFDDIKI